MQMKKCYLQVITNTGFFTTDVICTSFNVNDKLTYAFYDGPNLIASYPINRTIIYKIEKINE